MYLRFLPFLFPFLFLSSFISLPHFVHFSSALPSPQKRCPSPLFRQSRSSRPLNGTSPHYSTPIHFFAITQDCQFVLARPDQLGQLPTLSVTSSASSSSDCAPSRINLLWSLNSPSPSLLLLQQRAHNQICLLPIEVPLSVIAYSTELFRYSLRNALRHFALCHVSNSSSDLSLDPNLVFADSLYSDILYFLAPFSSPDSLWSVHQFRLSPLGRLSPRNTFRRVKPMLENISQRKSFPRGASPFLLASDPQRKRLFAVPRAQSDLAAEPIKWTCPFDLIFRPNFTRLRLLSLFPRLNSLFSPDSQLSGFAVDRNVAIFTESVRNSRDTFVFVAKFRGKNANSAQVAESHCVLKLPYGAKFGVISDQTLEELRNKGPLPSMGEDKQKEGPSEEGVLKLETESAASTRDPSAGVTSTSAPRRGHIISMPKAQTAPHKVTTLKMTTAEEEAEKKMRLEDDEEGEREGEREEKGEREEEKEGGEREEEREEKGEREEENDGGEREEENEGRGGWSNDYEQWRGDQPVAEGDYKVVVPLTEDGMGPAQLRAKVPSGDKSANTMKQKNGARRKAQDTAFLLWPMLLALIINFSSKLKLIF